MTADLLDTRARQMFELDEIIADAVARDDVPFVVAMVANRGDVLWEGSAGLGSHDRPAAPDTVFRLLSMTKGIGALGVMILIDRGMLSFETPVSAVLPEFGHIEVLVSVGPDGPVLRPPRRPVTVRHLLTHTAGLAYNSYSPEMAAYEAVTGAADFSTGTVESMNQPLLFDPGDGFAYGIGNDWAGRVVSRIDGRAIDRFCQEEIFDPLGMSDTRFEPDPVLHRLADVRFRGEDGGFEIIEFGPPRRPEVYGLGTALYGTAPDYLRFLRMVLNCGTLDGRRVISPETCRLMMTNQIGRLTVPALRSIVPLSADVDFFPGARKTWTAAFLRNEQDVPGRRSAGSLSWAGFANTHYWIDPVSKITAVFMTQALPFCDPRVMRAYGDFERAVYRKLKRPDEPDRPTTKKES